MAITPGMILELFKAGVSAEEEARIDEIEDEIDIHLKLNYVEDETIPYPVPDEVSWFGVRELMKRFREAGWSVTAFKGSTTGFIVLYFSENKYAPVSSTDRPQRLTGVN